LVFEYKMFPEFRGEGGGRRTTAGHGDGVEQVVRPLFPNFIPQETPLNIKDSSFNISATPLPDIPNAGLPFHGIRIQ
jgi:hypothetical protein